MADCPEPFTIAGYGLRQGTASDRARLLHCVTRTYQELAPGYPPDHLSITVEQHFSPETPLWWVVSEGALDAVACLWLGNGIDQRTGDRHGYILLLYVEPAHRRRGIATALLQAAEAWAQARGDRQIGLQVFCENEAAIALYRKLGYTPTALWMTKSDI